MRKQTAWIVCGTIFIVTAWGCGKSLYKELDGTWTLASWTCGNTVMSGTFPEGSVVTVKFSSNATRMSFSGTRGACTETRNFSSTIEGESTVKLKEGAKTCTEGSCQSPFGPCNSSDADPNAKEEVYTATFGDNDSLTLSGMTDCDDAGTPKETTFLLQSRETPN